MMDFDLSVYLVTDRPLCGGRDLMDVIRAGVAGGVTMVQLREKEAGTREFVELARAVKKMLAEHGVPLLINDRVDVALASGADGVHVGQSDMEAGDVRALVGPGAIVGLSTDTLDEIMQAQVLPVDYLGVGPIFETQTKTDTKPAWGIERFAKACEVSKLPLVAIGSVKREHAADLMRAGAAGIAVVSAICAAESPEAAAMELMDEVRAARSAV
jgi:thiamine-phosphate pyrophosphorylase